MRLCHPRSGRGCGTAVEEVGEGRSGGERSMSARADILVCPETNTTNKNHISRKCPYVRPRLPRLCPLEPSSLTSSSVHSAFFALSAGCGYLTILLSVPSTAPGSTSSSTDLSSGRGRAPGPEESPLLDSVTSGSDRGTNAPPKRRDNSMISAKKVLKSIEEIAIHNGPSETSFLNFRRFGYPRNQPKAMPRRAPPAPPANFADVVVAEVAETKGVEFTASRRTSVDRRAGLEK